MQKLSNLPNIGSVLERQLQQGGIDTQEKLKETGSREAWLMIKAIDPSACYNRLCGLEGAIQEIRWHNLSDTDKKSLKEFYNKYKG